MTMTWGDGTTSRASVYNDGTFKAVHQFVKSVHLPVGNQPNPFFATVTDKDGASSSISAPAFQVLNVAPMIGKIVVVPSSTAGGDSTFTVPVNDPGSADSLTYAWSIDGLPLSSSDSSRSTSVNVPYGTSVVRLHISDNDGGSADFSTLVMTGPGDLIANDVLLIASGVTSVTMLASNNDVTLDASALSAQYPAYLIGGTGTDTMLGGKGYTVALAQHDALIDTRPGTGARCTVISHSTVAWEASDGNDNALDFSLNGFGVTFDLSQVNATLDASPIQDLEPGVDPNQHFVQASGRISELDGSNFADQLTGTNDATLIGGAGNDTYLVPTGVTSNLSVVEAGNDNNDNSNNQVTVAVNDTVSGLTVSASQGAGIDIQNSGLLFRDVDDGCGDTVPRRNRLGRRDLLVYEYIERDDSGEQPPSRPRATRAAGIIFTNYGSMSAGSTGPVLSIKGDGTGSGGGIFSFTNTSTGTINGTTNVSTSGSTGVIFTNYGSMSGTSGGPVLSAYGDGAGSGGGIFSRFT